MGFLLQLEDTNDFLDIYNGGSDDSEMVAKLTGQMNNTTISISGRQMVLVFKTNHEIIAKGFHALIMESKHYAHNKLSGIRNCILHLSLLFYFIDDHCQYWLNEADGTLTSPNFGVNDLGYYHNYDHDLNCTWILNAAQGYYITLEIEFFVVNCNSKIYICFYNFSNKVDQSSFGGVTISQSMMDQISNHHQYQNSMKDLIIIKRVFPVLDITCWFNL